MKIKRYYGATLPEAVAELRRELGADAVVLNTRRVVAPGWRAWLRRYDRVEVTAAWEGVAARRAAATPRTPAGVGAHRGATPGFRTAGTPAAVPSGSGPYTQPAPSAAVAATAAPSAPAVAGPVAGTAALRPAVPALDRREGSDADRVRGDLLEAAVGPAASLGPPQPVAPRAGECRLVVLVGPTGAGKTTTAAKLAAQLHLEHGWRVGLVAADTFRAGAVDQLGAYARLLGLPMEVAPTPAALERALARMGAADVILVDTSGRSHRDAARMSDLRGYLVRRGAPPAVWEVHLVMPASTRAAEAEAMLGAYRSLGPDRLLLTKLDECEDREAALGLCARAGLPLSYCTAGQRVPEDIAVAWPDRLLAWAREGSGRDDRREPAVVGAGPGAGPLGV